VQGNRPGGGRARRGPFVAVVTQLVLGPLEAVGLPVTQVPLPCRGGLAATIRRESQPHGAPTYNDAMRHWWRALCAGGVLAAAIAGCAETGGVPVAGPSGLPPGTHLADWLISPPGTVVLGTTFPGPDGGFAALLLVVDRPLAAVHDVLRQAADAGFTVPTYGGAEPSPVCGTRSGADWAGGGELRPIGGALPEDTRWLTCDFHAMGPGYSQGYRGLSLNLVVGTGGQPYLSHLYLEERRVPGAEVPKLFAAVPTIPASADELDPPRYPAALPGPGQRLAKRFAPDEEAYRVLDGSHLVGPEFPSTCATGGFHAVLRLDSATIDEYDDMARTAAFRQMSRADADPDQTFRFGDSTATYRAYNAPGGGYLVLVAVSRPRGPTFLLLSRCND